MENSDTDTDDVDFSLETDAENTTPEIDDDEVDWDNNLDSDEITEILGFDLSAEEGDDRSGLRALINSALVAHRRLPMLDVIFDRTARALTTNFRKLTDDHVEVSLDDVSSTRFGDFIETVSAPSIVGVVKSTELDNYMLIAIDAELVYSVVDLLLGGRRSGSTMTIDDRKFTPIELALTERILSQIVEALGTSFEPVRNIGLSLDRLETTPRFAAIAQSASVCSLAKYRVEMENRGGRVVILTPHATLEPIQKLLLREFLGEAHMNEAAWREHLLIEVAGASLELRAVLSEKEMTVGEVATLKKGETIMFNATADTFAQVRAGAACIGHGAIGRSGSNVAVRLAAKNAGVPPTTKEDAA